MAEDASLHILCVRLVTEWNRLRFLRWLRFLSYGFLSQKGQGKHESREAQRRDIQGSATATNASPAFVRGFPPPPAAITTYCLPFTS